MGALCGGLNDQQLQQQPVQQITIEHVNTQVERLAQIMTDAHKADLNKDGIVTRDEMESYLATQLQTREQELCRLRTELIRVQSAYESLSKQFTSSTSNHCSMDTVHEKIYNSQIDDQAISIFVQSMLDDPNVNIHGMPDIIERAMYTRAAKMTLGSLGKIFENIALELMGHKIHVVMRPGR